MKKIVKSKRVTMKQRVIDFIQGDADPQYPV